MDVSALVESQREFFRTGQTLDVKWRLRQLRKLRKAVFANVREIENALAEDLGRSAGETLICEVLTVLSEINDALRGLRRWARPETRYSGLLNFPSIFTKVYKMPYGVTLLISPFNYPFILTMDVLVASIAGGNTAVIKTSSKTPASSAVISRIVSSIFSPEYVIVVEGGHDVADMLLAQRFDKIFYTGSPAVGKHILDMASDKLTPVALELGGEMGNWCIVRKDADIRDAARKVAFAKILNAGQICININQVAVAEEVASDFIEALKAEFARQIGADATANPEYPKLITPAAYAKCAARADEYRSRIVYGGFGDENSLKYSPTVIYPVGADEDIVRHELFCPLLPVVPYRDSEIDSLLRVIEEREHPLAMYVFTRDLRWAKRVMSSLQFGGGCINEVISHLIAPGVPFNGTGHSGMGAYHGKWGFREFTHPQTVLIGSRHFNLSLREHPYAGKFGTPR